MEEFKFINFGSRVKIYVNNILAQLNIYYKKTDNIKIDKLNNSELGEPFDEIKYQAFFKNEQGEIKSNIASIFINFPPQFGIPRSSNKEITILNSDEITITNQMFFNENVDRLKIVNYKNIGKISFNSDDIFLTKEIMQYDFYKLKFKPLDSGTGQPYQEIKYLVGNSTGYNNNIYSLKINIEGLASLVEKNAIDIQENESSKSIIYRLNIKNGAYEKTAKLKIEPDLDINVFNPDKNDKITISVFNSTFEIKENQAFEITTVLDKNGEDEVFTDIQLFLENKNINGLIKFTLLEIDGKSDLVSEDNVKILTITSTQTKVKY